MRHGPAIIYRDWRKWHRNDSLIFVFSSRHLVLSVTSPKPQPASAAAHDTNSARGITVKGDMREREDCFASMMINRVPIVNEEDKPV